jgi:phosphatidylglycerophosphate synthase
MPTALGAGTRPGAHVREHRSVLAAAEKRLLVWIARRLPRAITADHLTAFGGVGTAGAALAFAAARWTPWALAAVPLFLAINWFGDSLDGTVARVRDQQRPRYGFYVDHVVDLVNASVLFGGLAASTLMHPELGLALLVAYVLLCAESFLATHAVGVFRLSFSGIGPTELRILLSAGALAAIARPVVMPFGLGPIALFDVGAALALAGMIAAFLISAFRNGRQLYREEPIAVPQCSSAAVLQCSRTK